MATDTHDIDAVSATGPGADGTFDLDRFLALPRVSGLRLSPDGTRLVAAVATVGADRKRFVTALWEIDPAGARPPRRLTRSGAGEAHPAFLPDGGLLFTSSRPDADAPPRTGEEQEEVATLWLLPPSGGEARPVAAPAGGVEQVAVARDRGTVVYGTAVHHGRSFGDEDAAQARARREAGVTARLLEGYPLRRWDHWLAPRERHLVAAAPPEREPDGRLGPGRDLVPTPGPRLEESAFDVTPDGAAVVVALRHEGSGPLDPGSDLVAVDTTTGEQRRLDTGPVAHDAIACSPDGRWVVSVRTSLPTPERADDQTLWLVDLATGAGRDLCPDLDLSPLDPRWTPDSAAVLFTADEDGRTPVLRVEVAGPDAGRVTRLATDAAYSDLCLSPDGSTVYALRAAPDTPPHAVALDARRPGPARPLPTPGDPRPGLPSRLERLTARAADGTTVSSWLVLPEGASTENPAPLLLWIHGGPVASWTGWHWRWSPHLLAARGYAVLLPDPALSTGYGHAFRQRGWGRWGEAPYTDLMAALDGALSRPDLDATRVAAMGGSFGGYMANWIAGHTDRFRCIVTHASLWALRQFHGTTDESGWWELEFGDPDRDGSRYRDSSPHLHAGAIRTPMLVVHGDLDYRVPVSEGLRLVTDLLRHGVPARFLHFPDENHWVLKPQNARVWYETVFAFLDEHMLGRPFQRPALL